MSGSDLPDARLPERFAVSDVLGGRRLCGVEVEGGVRLLVSEGRSS